MKIKNPLILKIIISVISIILKCNNVDDTEEKSDDNSSKQEFKNNDRNTFYKLLALKKSLDNTNTK